MSERSTSELRPAPLGGGGCRGRGRGRVEECVG